MPWTPTLLLPQEPELLDAFLLAVGKALCLANNFEARVEFYLDIIVLTDGLGAGSDLTTARAEVKKSRKFLLARQIEELGKSGDVDARSMEVLENARKSRNFIAHEGASIGELTGASRKYLTEKLQVLHRHVVAIAEGDNLVSQWEFIISERDFPPTQFVEEYVERVVDWVFSPVASLVELSEDD